MKIQPIDSQEIPLLIDGHVLQFEEPGHRNGSMPIPYQTDARKVVKVGVKFDVDTRVPESWVVG